MGRERWVSVGIFLTAFMPSGLGLSTSWELVEAASELGGELPQSL